MGQLDLPVHGTQLQPGRRHRGTVTVAEVEHLSEDAIDPDHVVTPGVYVDRLVLAREREKEIEQRTVRERTVRQEAAV